MDYVIYIIIGFVVGGVYVSVLFDVNKHEKDKK